MAIWGPQIYDNDSASDIRDAFQELISSGMNPQRAKEQIMSSFSEMIQDVEDCPLVKLALADQLNSVGALCDNDKAEILDYLHSGGDLDFWRENAPQLVKSRKIELEKFEKRILSAKAKKSAGAAGMKKKQLLWEIGEIYAIPICSDEADVLELQNEYILLYFFGETKQISGYRSPQVWAKVTKGGHLPKDADEFNQLEYVQIASTAMEARFLPFKSELELPLEYNQPYLPDKWGYLPEYTMTIYESKGNHPPESLTLLGKFPGVLPPIYNYRRYKSAHGAAWRHLEEFILQRYRLYNLHEAPLYNK